MEVIILANSDNNTQKSAVASHIKFILVTVLCVLAVVGLVLIIKSCDGSGKVALEYRDPNDNVTATVDQELLSLMVAHIKFEYGLVESNDTKDFWEAGNGFFANKVIADAADNAGRMLRSEYYADFVEGTPLTAEQKKKIDDTVAYWVKAYGSEDDFSTFLSSYGTSIDALRRYMELALKQKNLKEFMYLRNYETAIKDEQVIEFFKEQYSIADFIFISLTAGTKSNGDPIPLTGEAKQLQMSKRDAAMVELNSGMDFEEVMKKYSDASYEEYKALYL